MDNKEHPMAEVTVKRQSTFRTIVFFLLIWFMGCPVHGGALPDEGIKAEMAGEWQKAIAIYRRMLESEPRRIDLWRRIAQIRIHLKDISGAINALQNGIEFDPDDAVSHFDLATLYSMEGRPEEAFLHAQKAKSAEPNNIKYLQTHAQLANWLKRFSEAAESYQRIYMLQPDNETMLQNAANSWSWAGEHAKAADLYQRYLNRHPGRASIWLALSRERSRLGDSNGANAALLRAHELNPDNAQLNAELSRFYAAQNQPDKALVYARQALEIEPDNLDYLRAHAQIANWAKRPSEAADSLEKILVRMPDEEQLIGTLAKTYQWAGDQERATDLYERLLQKRPNDLKLWLKVVDGKIAQKKNKDAIALLERAYARFISKPDRVDEQNRKKSRKVPVLLYHCIGKQADNDYWISSDEFDAQMAELKRLGYSAVTSRDLEGYLFGTQELPSKPVMISFDDACRNLYTYARPILKKHGFTADIYIFTDAIRNSAVQRASLVQRRQGKETKLDYMVWPEIKEMIADGFVIGAHSKSHADMKLLGREELKLEILYSKLKILAETGVEVSSFSYPYGSGFHREEVHQELEAAGFRIAFAAHGGIAHLGKDDPMEIPRIEIWGPHPNSDPGSLGVSVVPDPKRPYDLFQHRLEPGEAGIHYELSRLYAMAEDPKRAYREIKRALELDPKNRRYLRDMTQLANWNDQHALAVEGYRQLAALGEEDDQLLLNQARVSSYAGNLDESARYYERYLQQRPDDREAAMEQIKVESWRGNTGKAVMLLERYRERFGEDGAWLKTKADIFSWGGRPRETERLVAPGLQKDPDDYQLNYASVLAAHFGGRPHVALERLQNLERRHPDNEDNRLLQRVVMASYRPKISLDSAYVTSSEDLQALSTTLGGTYSFTPELQLNLKYVQEWFSARLGSGLEAIDGSSGAQYQNIQAGASYRFSSALAADFHVGHAAAEGGSMTVSGFGFDVSPLDTLDLRLQYGQDYFHEYYASSPKTLSLNIKEESARFYLNWRPDFNHRISAQIGSSRFSDDNSSRNLQLSVRRAMIRTQRWNVDVGLTSGLLDFAAKKENGYYEPDYYQRYMFAGEAYWKATDLGGVFFSLALGVAKDESMTAFKLASEGGISGEFELDENWWLRFGVSGVHNVTRGGDAYTGSGFNLSVSRRF